MNKSSQPLTVGSVIHEAEEIIAERKLDSVCFSGVESARSDAEVLASHILKIPRNQLLISKERSVSQRERDAVLSLANARADVETPVAYLTGETEFYGYPFYVGPGVLIPRPETELIAEEAIKEKPERAVDLGSGSGCLAIAIARKTGARVLAVESSEEAASWLKKNIALNTIEDRVTLRTEDAGSLSKADVESTLGGPIDVVVANPPYIAADDPALEASVRRHEPHRALFSGEDGYQHIRRWAKIAAQILRPGGLCLFEIGYQQGAEAKKIFEGLKVFSEVAVERDYSDHDRYIRARR